MMRLALLLLALPLSAAVIKKDQQSEALPPDKFAEAFLKVPVEDLEPDAIEDFLTIDPKILPPRLQAKAKARRLELFTLKQLAQGRRKGLVRTPDKECSIPKEAKADEPAPLKHAGYMEITEEEEQYLLDRTKCTEQELLCETTLQLIIELDAKGKPKKRRYFLYPNDPLSPLIAGKRSSKSVGGNTAFFGQQALLCSH